MHIQNCGVCKKVFAPADTKHHCRACGGGFCDKCSAHDLPVPWKGWGHVPVRVCDHCHQHYSNIQRPHRSSVQDTSKDTTASSSEVVDSSKTVKDSDRDIVTARYVGEVVQSAVGTLSCAITYPRSVIVESARPVYWVPDATIKTCHQCKLDFVSSDAKHHCRACGQGFCDNCSGEQRAVPSRGWDYPVRVCDTCAERTDL